MGDKKLAAVGTSARICHGKHTGAVVLQGIHNFILKAISRTTSSISLGISTLNHEVADDTMELQPVVKGISLGCIQSALRQTHKIRHGEGSLLVVQLKHNVTL